MEFTVDVFNSTDHSLQAFLRAEDAAGQPEEKPFALAGLHFVADGEVEGTFFILDPEKCPEEALKDVLARFYAMLDEVLGRRLTEVGIAARAPGDFDPEAPPDSFNVLKLAESPGSVLLGLKEVGADGDVAEAYTLLLDLYKLDANRLVCSALVFDARFYDRERMGALMHWLLDLMPELETYQDRALEVFHATFWGWAELS